MEEFFAIMTILSLIGFVASIISFIFPIFMFNPYSCHVDERINSFLDSCKETDYNVFHGGIFSEIKKSNGDTLFYWSSNKFYHFCGEGRITTHGEWWCWKNRRPSRKTMWRLYNFV